MDYLQRPLYHFKPKSGWMNDPNGLVYFQGYYHAFYQHSPEAEVSHHPMHWGHARTKDFIEWEELPLALCPDTAYDDQGCWSGTAIVKDGVLYLFYASLGGNEKKQNASVAFSADGIHFEKYKSNPVIEGYPAEGDPDFRDPAICCINGQYYCIVATGHRALFADSRGGLKIVDLDIEKSEQIRYNRGVAVADLRGGAFG